MKKIIIGMLLFFTYICADGFTNTVGMKFVKIPAGTFMMGISKSKCPKDDPFTQKNEYKECLKKVNNSLIYKKDEMPYHKVEIKSFYIQTTEVTQLQYYKVMGTNPAYFKEEQLGYSSKNNPIENVSWYDAIEFINKLNALEHTDKYYLPSEEEWEYAAKAGSSYRWFFGDSAENLTKYAWYGKNSDFRTHPVAEKKPNGWGLYDIYGNVGEWTSSNYSYDYNSPKISRFRVVRGGSWNTNLDFTDATSRLYAEPDYYYGYYGFRVAKKE